MYLPLPPMRGEIVTYYAIVGEILFDETDELAIVTSATTEAFDLETDDPDVAVVRADRLMTDSGSDGYIVPDLSRKQIVFR